MGLAPLVAADKPRIPVEFVGENPPEHIKPLAELMDGEEKRGFGVWKDDLYGTRGVLGRKRKERGWSKREEEIILQGERNEVVKRLVRWEGDGLFGGMDDLPWT